MFYILLVLFCAWRTRVLVFFSQTEMDLESHRRIASKQKVLLFFCVKVY